MSEPVHTTETPAPVTSEAPNNQPETAEPAEQAPATDWEAEAKKWEKRSKDNYAKLKDAEPKLAEYEKWQRESQSELERAQADLARWQGEAESWRTSAVSSRVQALASDFADPSDAVGALADRNYLDASGQLDDAAISRDLAEVLERKPHWRKPEAAEPSQPRAPLPNRNQGSGGGTPAPVEARDQFAAILQGALHK